jgi:hypothetical protein
MPQKVTERMYLNADKTKIVTGGADAAFLFKIPGDTLTDEERVQYGLATATEKAATANPRPPRRGTARARNAEAVNEDELEADDGDDQEKAAESDEDKAAGQGEDKSRGPAANKSA